MHLPPLPSITNSHVIVTGDVSIDKSAAIAPGVILQADPDSRIIIAAGVCIGMGAILHAHKGTLEIDPGAILGAGVLIVGVGKIGANACIGAATTIWNSSVDSWQVLPAGSLVGDTGRKIADIADNSPLPPKATPQVTPEIKPANLEAPTSTEEVKPLTDKSVEVKQQEVEAETPAVAPAATAFEDNGIKTNSEAAIEQPATAPTESPATPEVELNPQPSPDSDSNSAGVTVYGQAHLNRLLLTLFPYKSATNPPQNQE